MGFYLRKASRPDRYHNPSTSGVGVSVGVPASRVGTGPRGNYIGAGKAGGHYRSKIDGSRRQPAHPPARPPYTPPREQIWCRTQEQI